MQATLVDVIVIVEHKDRIDVALIIVYLLITHLVRTHSSYKLKVSCGPFAVCYTILSRTCRLRFRQLTKRNPTPSATSWLFVLILVSSLFCSLVAEEGDTMEWHRLFACLPAYKSIDPFLCWRPRHMSHQLGCVGGKDFGDLRTEDLLI